MTNFLYCFDSNYNVQATVSISTLLEKYDSEVNLYILHDNPRLFEKYKTKLKKYKNLNKIEIYKFEDTNYDFQILTTHMFHMQLIFGCLYQIICHKIWIF